MTDSSWGLVVARPARRAIDRLPAKIAVAVVDYILGSLLDNPHRVGEPLRGELSGLHSARVGTYRIVYEISKVEHMVSVVYIDHRADIYRPL
ncbi:MAG: type II toxin-antitoxin system RelE/ParE family toxin [Acidimicrobiaceae bacterium]|nr:type II toxin-antitoxin system RelE/ParE family toxin [Acidimicrobiaceae bacterium]